MNGATDMDGGIDMSWSTVGSNALGRSIAIMNWTTTLACFCESPRIFFSPTKCQLLGSETFIIVALECKELLEMRFAIQFALQRGVVSELQPSLAMRALEARNVVNDVICYQLFRQIDCLTADVATICTRSTPSSLLLTQGWIRSAAQSERRTTRFAQTGNIHRFGVLSDMFFDDWLVSGRIWKCWHRLRSLSFAVS